MTMSPRDRVLNNELVTNKVNKVEFNSIHDFLEMVFILPTIDEIICLKVAGTSMPTDFQSVDFCICASNCYSNIFVDNIGELSHFGLI